MESMEFATDSMVKNATVTSGNFKDLERGNTTGAVVSPPIIEAKMNEGSMGQFKKR